MNTYELTHSFDWFWRSDFFIAFSRIRARQESPHVDIFFDGFFFNFRSFCLLISQKRDISRKFQLCNHLSPDLEGLPKNFQRIFRKLGAIISSKSILGKFLSVKDSFRWKKFENLNFYQSCLLICTHKNIFNNNEALQKLLVSFVAMLSARVSSSLALRDARFRMKISLAVVRIRSLASDVCVPGRLRRGTGVALN